MLDRENCPLRPRQLARRLHDRLMICNLLGAFLDDAALHAACAVENTRLQCLICLTEAFCDCMMNIASTRNLKNARNMAM